MKIILFNVFSLLALVQVQYMDWTPEARQSEARQVQFWKDNLEQARKKPPEERPEALWLGLRNMSYRTEMDGHSPEVDLIFKAIQGELLSIPGHARYFADLIKKEQKEVAPYPTNNGPRVSYNRHRTLYFGVLSKLPSPEALAVLGEFLGDDKDTPVPKVSPDSDWGANAPANSSVSSYTIKTMQLRNPPVAEDEPINEEAEVLLTRAWWEEIKSGKRVFSFVGQKVEYRFRADGSWETTALEPVPDGAPRPKSRRRISRITRSGQGPVSPPVVANNVFPMVWLIVASAFLFAGAAWFVLRKRGGNV